MHEFSWGLIKPLKVRSGKTIASFNKKATDQQIYPIMIHYDKHTIRSNAPIIIIQIKSFKLEAWG